jgi:integrase
MAVYRPTYTDPKTGEIKTQNVWWYHFNFAGRHIQESSKSTRKTIATDAEKKRRLELEKSFNGIEDNRRERVRSVAEIAAEFLENYGLRNPRSKTFAEYAVGHLTRLLGKTLMVAVSDATVKAYQTARLKETASPKSINEEAGFLLRMLGEQGDFIRAKMRRLHTLKLAVHGDVARAFAVEEKAALLASAKKRRSRAIYPALMLALHVGLRDAEIRGLQWGRIDLHKAMLTVGDSKTEAGQGRTIPLNGDVLAALVEHSKWFLEKFKATQPDWYVFPFGQPQPTDPTRPMVTLKTSWAKVKADACVTGRWHDNRHTFITDLAESGEAGDETIRDMAGHVSKQMLKHYSHIRMEAKRRAVESLVTKTVEKEGTPSPLPNVTAKESAKVELLN